MDMIMIMIMITMVKMIENGNAIKSWIDSGNCYEAHHPWLLKSEK